MADVEAEKSYLNAIYLDSITEKEQHSSSVRISVGLQTLTFKLDTGAEVTTTSKEAYYTQV